MPPDLSPRDLRAEAQQSELRSRFLTHGGTKVAEAITGGAASKALTFANSATEKDTSYGVVANPNWNTSVYVTSKTVTGFTLNFGTVAPGGGGTVDWIVFR